MFEPINLARPIHPDSTMDEDDVFNTKTALKSLGHFKTPVHGLTRFPDIQMIDGVRSFQRANGLRDDGVMNPEGPTIKRLNGELAKQQAAVRNETKFQRLPLLNEGVSPPTIELFNDTPGKPFPTRPGAPTDEKPPKADLGIEVAAAGALAPITRALLPLLPRRLLPDFLRGLAGGGAGTATGSLSGDTPNEGQDGATTSAHTDFPPDLPPTPPSEPPEKFGSDDEEFPAESPFETVDLSQPIPEGTEPMILVHPVPPEELNETTIIERRGNEVTRKELEKIRDFFLEKGWRHIAGGRFAQSDPEVLAGKAKAGGERREQHIPGPGIAFDGDSRPGGHFSDLTFVMPDGRTVHIQSVDVDRHGKPTKRELDVAERIRRASKDTLVILIPKGAQLNRLRGLPPRN